MARRPKLGPALVLVLLVALAACDGGSSGASATTTRLRPTATSTATAFPTVTPANQACATYMSSLPGVMRTGDLLVTAAGALTDSIVYQMPDGVPLKPLAVPARSTTGHFAGWPDSTLGASSVSVAVCNASTSTPHTIQTLRLKLADFAAYSGQLNEWDYCAGAYARPIGAAPNNCDRGGPQIDEELRAAFAPDAHVGDVVDATQQSNPTDDGFGPLPVTLPPGNVMYLNTILQVSAAGTYSFSASITADRTQLPFTGAASLLLAPAAHLWNGTACATPDMLAQIPPATTPPTDYICPIF